MNRPSSAPNASASDQAAQAQLLLPLASSAPATATSAVSDLPPMEIRRHPRARRLSIRVHPGGRVVVVTPPRAGPAVVARFIGAHRDWIIRTASEMAPATPPELPQTVRLAATGETLQLRVAPPRAGRGRRWQQRGDELVLQPADASATAPLGLLQAWLCARAREVGPALVAPISRETGLAPARLQFRLQRSRWGSCSSRRTVSLNACMLFLDARLLRYLVLHELCHLEHMHHGAAFWARVARHEPDCRALDRQLNAAWREVPGWVFAPT
ncbi:MAG: M48 family peptidase [Gammaproteobacteria bacterium]|nr:MAG: M48 family peptidase [Gammaproteobacteria bacterium]